MTTMSKKYTIIENVPKPIAWDDYEKWSAEKERRYQLFLFDEEKMVEGNFDNRFFKMYSSIVLFADFILGKEEIVNEIRRFREEKLFTIASRNYLYCNNWFKK